jgi:hypothetical protein
MEFEIGFRQKQELEAFRDTMKLRDAKGQKGLENYPVFETEDDRSAETTKEFQQILTM